MLYISSHNYTSSDLFKTFYLYHPTYTDIQLFSKLNVQRTSSHKPLGTSEISNQEISFKAIFTPIPSYSYESSPIKLNLVIQSNRNCMGSKR